ncbi:ATP-binding protein [Marimonas sp. MJW-29]|uniref:histidine kinase n=1 Tax=Sulfitobacter sediminis TaxID=3234186 RepID=A0ABV3RQC6_9RHOB
MRLNERALLDQIDHAIFVIEPDAEGRPVYACINRFACAILGRSEQSVIGLSAKELYPGRLGEIAFHHHAGALASGQPRSYEIHLPIRGSERLVRTTLRPVTDGRGHTLRLIGSSTDITGSHIMRQMQANVETMNIEAEDFVALAAHDLRAPLRHVSAIADMLREGFVDMGDGKLELIDMLEELGTRAMELIADVLSHAEATSLTPESTQSCFDFSDLVREVMGLLDPSGHCHCDIGEGRIKGDRIVTQIILRNLADNAIKYASGSDGHATLHLCFLHRDCGDGFVEVVVQDNGKGFADPAILFLQEGKLRTGSGFGLFGIRRLIRARGGTMKAENLRGGQGARVVFRLPGSAVSAHAALPSSRAG